MNVATIIELVTAALHLLEQFLATNPHATESVIHGLATPLQKLASKVGTVRPLAGVSVDARDDTPNTPA